MDLCQTHVFEAPDRAHGLPGLARPYHPCLDSRWELLTRTVLLRDEPGNGKYHPDCRKVAAEDGKAAGVLGRGDIANSVRHHESEAQDEARSTGARGKRVVGQLGPLAHIELGVLLRTGQLSAMARADKRQSDTPLCSGHDLLFRLDHDGQIAHKTRKSAEVIRIDEVEACKESVKVSREGEDDGQTVERT